VTCQKHNARKGCWELLLRYLRIIPKNFPQWTKCDFDTPQKTISRLARDAAPTHLGFLSKVEIITSKKMEKCIDNAA
jgi:hypothetical protein